MLTALLGQAEVDLKTFLLVAVPTLVGSAATWWITQRKQWVKERRAEKQEDMDLTIKRYEELLKRVDRDREEAIAAERESQKVVAALREQVRMIEIKAERAIAWIRHLEVALDRHEIPYPAFNESGDTGRHNPTPPEGGNRGEPQ